MRSATTASSLYFQCGRFQLPLTRPLVMGILNVTPDSFSDGGYFVSPDAALVRAKQMLAEGADLIDIGGESTRPGAVPVPLEEEMRRVLPVLETLRALGVPLSVDTDKPAMMRAALEAGADMINDVGGFQQPQALDVVAHSTCGLCVMHMRGDPQTMQQLPPSRNIIAEVSDFLQARIAALEAVGVSRLRMSVDPGFGFGKTVEQNYALLAHLNAITLEDQDRPILVGLSRKSMLGAVTGRPTDQRVAASVAAAVCAAERGAKIIRVHDVGPTVDALKVLNACRGKRYLEKS